MQLLQASRQFASRPADERFTSLPALAAFTRYQKMHSFYNPASNSRGRRVLPNRSLTIVPSTTDELDVACQGPNGHPAKLTHWSFGQLSALAGVPASYLIKSKMPGALMADNLNWGLHHSRPVESVSLHAFYDHAVTPQPILRAINGPDYGMIWDADIAETLVDEFGDGVSGQWRVPGEFGKKLSAVTQANTTLYASDRDMWVFLADEERRIELLQRRNGEPGSLARGFYVRNSETGASALVLGMFLFDYVCCNRIIWGAQQHQEIRIRHTSGAPHRWLEEIKPILTQYSQGSPKPVEETIRLAQQSKLKTDVAEFLATRFGTTSLADKIIATHQLEEGRPIETTWDAVVGATAYARQLVHVDARTALERKAGELLPIPRLTAANLGL